MRFDRIRFNQANDSTIDRVKNLAKSRRNSVSGSIESELFIISKERCTDDGRMQVSQLAISPFTMHTKTKQVA